MTFQGLSVLIRQFDVRHLWHPDLLHHFDDWHTSIPLRLALSGLGPSPGSAASMPQLDRQYNGHRVAYPLAPRSPLWQRHRAREKAYDHYNDPQCTSYHTGARLVCGGHHGASVLCMGSVSAGDSQWFCCRKISSFLAYKPAVNLRDSLGIA